MHGWFWMLVCLVTLALPHRPARACSPAPFTVVRLFPWGIHEVPGNLVYFKLNTEEPGPLRLRKKNGRTIPASTRRIGPDRVFAPDEPIAPGTEVVLEYQTREGVPQTYAFRTGEHSQVSPQPAQLTLVERGLRAPGTDDEHGFQRFTFYAGDSLELQHLRDLYAQVDGQDIAFETFEQQPTVVVLSDCKRRHSEPLMDTCGQVRSVPLGRHELVVGSRFVGHEPKAPVTVQLETSCSVGSAAKERNPLPAQAAPPPAARGCAAAQVPAPRSAALWLLLWAAGLRLRPGGRGSKLT